MPTLKLNIYTAENLNEIEKTYTAESFDLMFGTAEDFMQIIGFDQLKSKQEVAMSVMRAFNSLKPMLKEIFTGVTDDELKRTKVKELLPLYVDIFDVILKDLEELMPKNAPRA